MVLALLAGSTLARSKVKKPAHPTTVNSIFDQDIMEKQHTGDTAEELGISKSSMTVKGDETTRGTADSMKNLFTRIVEFYTHNPNTCTSSFINLKY